MTYLTKGAGWEKSYWFSVIYPITHLGAWSAVHFWRSSDGTLASESHVGAPQVPAASGLSLSEARRYNALRRDFTVNGMLYDPFQRLIYDYVGGLKDCQLRRLRTIGEPAASFEEDPARILRCIRMSARCGE